MGQTTCGGVDPTDSFVDNIPDLAQVGYSNNGDFSQTTSATITEGFRYTLKVSVGGRGFECVGNDYLAQILGDGAIRKQAGGTNEQDTWTEETVVYNSPLADPNAGETIGIALINNGGVQVNWDKVSLKSEQVLTCQSGGFLTPFDEPLSFKKKTKRAIPVKMVLVDVYGTEITDADIAPPVVQVTKGDKQGLGIAGYDGDLLPAGLSDDGNEFRYDLEAGHWIINLATKHYTASGTYIVSVAGGDGSYVVDGCSQTFERQS